MRPNDTARAWPPARPWAHDAQRSARRPHHAWSAAATSSLRRATRQLTLALITAAACVLLTGAPASAATSSQTVSVDVSSVVSLTNNCTAPAAYQIGMVTSATMGLTATGGDVCSFTFASNNDTAMLRVYQRDGVGRAMAKAGGYTKQAGVLSHLGVSAASSSVAWLVGNGGGQHVSTDGGDTWTKPGDTPSTGQVLRAVKAFGENDAWFAGNGTTVVKRAAGTWSTYGSAQIGISTSFRGIDALDMNVMYLAGTGGSLAATQNGGTSWTATSSVNGITDTMYDVAVVNSLTACAVSSTGRVLKTTNGGSSWTETANLADLRAIDVAPGASNVLWAVGDRGVIYKSTDTCDSWTSQTSPQSLHTYVDVAARSSSVAYATQTDGAIAVTTNGSDWTEKVAPLATLEGVDVDAATGKVFVVGSGRTVAYSTDVADSWTFAPPGGHVVNAASIADIHAWDGVTVVAVGGSGLVRRTIDSGSTWTTVASGTTQHLRGVAVTDDDTMYAVGGGGTILASTDRGVTWSARTSGTSEQLRSISAYGSRLVAVGDNGTVVTSSNGTSWDTGISGTTASLHGVSMGSETVGWAVGSGGVLLKTTDGGATWSAQTSGTTNDLRAVDAVSASVAWAVGYGFVARTVDGSSWNATAPASAFSHYSIAASSADRAIVGLRDSAVATTVDGGSSWQGTNSTSVGSSVYAVEQVDDHTRFLGGAGYAISALGVAADIPDFNLGVNSWGVANTSFFGACLQAIGPDTTAGWQVDDGGTPGLCEASDGDRWNPIPTAPVTVARTTAVGDVGTADVVFGMRVSSSQEFGDYAATLVFEAVAPAL